MQAERFDVVLMDVQMPEMDGLASTRAIRHIESGRGVQVPIIGVTAHAVKGDRERCLSAGMDGYVSKPVRPAALFPAMVRLEASADRAPRMRRCASRSWRRKAILPRRGWSIPR